MRIPFLNTITVGFILIYFIMVSSIYLSVKTSKELYQSYDWIEHTYEVINQLDRLVIVIFKTSADGRGYYIFPNSDNNNLFVEDTLKLWRAMGDLQIQTRDNPIQQENIRQLNGLIRERISIINRFWIKGKHKDLETITLGFEVTNQSNSKIFALHKKMTAHEKRLLEERKNLASSDVIKSKNYNLIAGTGTFFLGILFIYVLRKDLIRRKVIENELRELNDNKNKFFSIISHDLRGPIYAAQQLSEIITEKQYQVNEKEKANMTDMIKHSIKKVSSLLEDLLEWSKIQMERIEYKSEPLNLKEIVNDSIDRYRAMIVNKRLEVHNLISDDCKVLGDSYMVSTIMRNLINNAIKFTKEDRNIFISCKSNLSDFYEISVKDEGIGISKNNQDKLFKLGIKQSSIGTSKEVGTGLGLILVKEFVEKQKGKIKVESEEGKGSTFIFTLPKFDQPKKW
jgi:signal transduction histidine kinase